MPETSEMPVSTTTHTLPEVLGHPPICRIGRDAGELLPLSYSQQRLWFIYQMEPDSAAYNIPFGIKFRGRLDENAFERSINAIVRRHEILRTTFGEKDAVPFQKISAEATFVIPQMDLRSLPFGTRELEVGRRTKLESETPFDLCKGPLLRMKLLRISDWEYRLIGSMHHIITDAWSIGVMVREFIQLYQEHTKPKPSSLPELTVQYVDYTMWQKEWLTGAVEDNQISYWKNQLEGVPKLDLPTDHPRLTRTSDHAATLGVRLSRELTRDLAAVSRAHGVTLFMTLLAGFQILLHRYSGQPDITVGTPIANRTSMETERLIGPFVNTLVLRSDLSDNPTFAEVLKAVGRRCMDAYKHQDIPFDRLVQAIQPARDSARNPFFQVMFAMQNTPPRKLALPGLELEELVIDGSATPFDLLLFVQPVDGTLDCSLVYRDALWEAPTMKRMLGHWERLVQAAVISPGQHITDLPILQSWEEDRLLRERKEVAPYLDTQLVHQKFEVQARQKPDAIAVIFADRRVSYGELNRKANQFADCLRRSGIVPDSRVGICLDRSLEAVVAILAVLKAGGAYVPMDPLYPKERINLMLRDAHPAVLITTTNLREIFEVPLKTICLDQEWERLAAYYAEDTPTDTLPANLAVVLYTSGSTGRPKGVMMSQEPLCNLLAWQNQALSPEGRTVQVASLSFDVSFQEMFSALTTGQDLIMLSDDTRRNPEAIREVIARERADRIDTPCVILHTLFTGEEQTSQSLETLKEIISAGDKLEITDELRHIFQALPRARLHNQYGPTETHVVTSYTLSVDHASWTRYPPIGQPIPNAYLYVLDKNMALLPIGVPGELYIGGACLSRGYLDQPGLTAEKFVPHPFSARPGQRLYKTGDLVRWLIDGNIEFLGRGDYQVKIRGFRVELGEIEEVLAQHACIDRSVVMVHEEQPGNKRLVAYMVPKPSAKLVSARNLREYAKSQLPEYMVPAGFVWLEQFPLNRNGKIDRKQLRPPRQLEAQERNAPRTPVEEILAGIWESVLGIEGVGTTDNFFEIGGHSLLATRVISRVRSSLAVDLPLRALFECPTIVELARRISSKEKTLTPAIQRSLQARSTEFPLSFGQERIWFLEQFDPGNSAYHLPLAVQLEGMLNIEALRQALQDLIRRHEILRTVFVSPLGHPTQRIKSDMPVSLRVQDLMSGQSEIETLSAVKKILAEDAAKPFDFENGPLLRALLLRLAPDNYIMQLAMHHIIVDGWSLRTLAKELGEIYQAQTNCNALELPELTLQYADYAIWQRENLGEEALQPQLFYWRKQLSGARAAELPHDRHPFEPVSNRASNRSLQIPNELLLGAKRLASQQHTTLFMVLLAAFQALLFRYSGYRDLTIGAPIANRNLPEIEELIGFFVNTVALRVQVETKMSFNELLRRAREVTIAAFTHQDLPFEKLVEAMRHERDFTRDPLFKIMFMVQNVPLPDLNWGPLRMKIVDVNPHQAKFELTFVLMERGEHLIASAEFQKDLYQNATIECFLRNYEELLSAVVRDPQSTLEDISLSMEKQLANPA